LHPTIPTETQEELITLSYITFWLEVEAIAKANALYSDDLEGILFCQRIINTSPAAWTLDNWVNGLSIIQSLIAAGYQMLKADAVYLQQDAAPDGSYANNLLWLKADDVGHRMGQSKYYLLM
jgi:hypothetical protein